MTEILVLLAIGLFASLVIGLVAFNLDEAGAFSQIRWIAATNRWIDKRFGPHLDRWQWGPTDRKLASISELAGLDRLERRRLHGYAVQSLRNDTPWYHWTEIPFYLIIGFSSYWSEPISHRLALLAIPVPLARELPGWVLASLFMMAVWAPWLGLIAWRHRRRTYSRVLKLFHQMSPEPN